jgi:hypothetical protein
MTVKNAVFWDMKTQKYYKIFLRSVLRMLVTANVRSSPIPTLIKEVLRPSESAFL